MNSEVCLLLDCPPMPRLQVNTDCWASMPSVVAWLKENGLTPDGGYEYFVNRVQVKRHGAGQGNWKCEVTSSRLALC